MNSIFQVAMACAFMLLNAGYGHAGLFAKGGGESRTITSVSPDTVLNNTGKQLTLSGHFSSRQSRDRRVVIYSDRVPTPFPVQVNHWSGRSIQVTLPAHLAPGGYHIYLERNAHHQWGSISNKVAFAVRDGSNARSDGLPHAAPIRVQYIGHACDGPPIDVRLSGGPFRRSGQPVAIRAELRTSAMSPSRMMVPTIRINSDTLLTAKVERCVVLQDGAQIRLVYPDRSTSNWVSIHQAISSSAGSVGSR